MGLITTLFKWLKTSSRKTSHDEQDLTEPIDIPQVIKDLKLLEAARSLGNAGQPHATASAASGPEVEILHLVESKRKQFVTQGFRRSSILNQSLAMNDITREVNAALDADKEFGQKAGALLTAKASMLKSSGDVTKARNEELAAFRAGNNLQRELSTQTVRH